MALLMLVPFTVAHAEPSVALCKSYAENFAKRQSSGQLFSGIAVGSAVGVAIGALAGGPAAGAAIGGGLGAIGGGARKSETYRKGFEDAFIDCMAGRTPVPQ